MGMMNRRCKFFPRVPWLSTLFPVGATRVLAIGVLAAPEEGLARLRSSLNHLPDQAGWALMHPFAIKRLETDVVPRDLRKLPDVARGLSRAGEQEYAPAGARQGDVEQPPLLSVGIGFG